MTYPRQRKRCEDCRYTTIAYNSCRNRHCPKCQGAAAKQWLAERQAELLPVPYYHVVFTLPAPIANVAYQNKAVIYDLLFKAAADTMLTIAADPKHLGARIGITAVLHTWGSAMTHHPHLHMIVPGGGLSLDGKKWLASRPGFFLPVRVLSRLFRRLFLKMLADAHAAGRLAFFGDHAALANAAAFAALLTPLRKAEWVVYAKKPFGGPQAVLAYLARYSHRVAIANSRLISADETGVTFKWKDYRIEGPGRYKTMTLPTHEFIRRFLIHVLPKGLHRIRHYGLFANGKHRAANICPPTARRAAKHSAEEYRSRRRIRSTSRSANAVPMLRWPLDHHRDLRARLSAQAHSGNDQDRYLMTPSPLTHDCPLTNRSRRHATANVLPRARPPILSALTPQTSPRNAPPVRQSPYSPAEPSPQTSSTQTH